MVADLDRFDRGGRTRALLSPRNFSRPPRSAATEFPAGEACAAAPLMSTLLLFFLGIFKPALAPASPQGYCLYSSSVIFVLSVGAGVDGFTYDRAIGEFVLTHPQVRSSTPCPPPAHRRLHPPPGPPRRPARLPEAPNRPLVLPKRPPVPARASPPLHAC